MVRTIGHTQLGCRVRDFGTLFQFLTGTKDTSPQNIQAGSGAHPGSYQWIPAAVSSGVNLPGHKADI